MCAQFAAMKSQCVPNLTDWLLVEKHSRYRCAGCYHVYPGSVVLTEWAVDATRCGDYNQARWSKVNRRLAIKHTSLIQSNNNHALTGSPVLEQTADVCTMCRGINDTMKPAGDNRVPEHADGD